MKQAQPTDRHHDSASADSDRTSVAQIIGAMPYCPASGRHVSPISAAASPPSAACSALTMIKPNTDAISAPTQAAAAESHSGAPS